MSTLEFVGAIVAAITGSVAVLSGLRQVYRNTAGRRRSLARMILQLGPGMYLGYFERVLGVPQLRSETAEGGVVATWIERNALVDFSHPG